MSKKEKDMIKNLNTNREINSTFLISNKEIKRSKKRKKYIELELMDKTGLITARYFPKGDVDQIFDSIEVGAVYNIKGKVSEFPPNSGKFSVILNQKNKSDEDLNDYIPSTPRDKDQMIREIHNTLKEMKNTSLKELLKSFFCDDFFTKKFFNYHSAKYYHHNYQGGLLEHTVGVLKICKTACQIFPELNQDLLYTGALLHDIGKLRTYDYDSPFSISYSQKGILLDHLFITADMVKEKINQIKISEELGDQVLHLILSHHGEVKNGWGSAVNPKTPEAVALHHADNLDAKVKGTLQRKII